LNGGANVIFFSLQAK